MTILFAHKILRLSISNVTQYKFRYKFILLAYIGITWPDINIANVFKFNSSQCHHIPNNAFVYLPSGIYEISMLAIHKWYVSFRLLLRVFHEKKNNQRAIAKYQNFHHNRISWWNQYAGQLYYVIYYSWCIFVFFSVVDVRQMYRWCGSVDSDHIEQG